MGSSLGRSPKRGKLDSYIFTNQLSNSVIATQIVSCNRTRGGQVFLVIPCVFDVSFFSSDASFRIYDSLALLTGGHFHDSGR